MKNLKYVVSRGKYDIYRNMDTFCFCVVRRGRIINTFDTLTMCYKWIDNLYASDEYYK